MEPRGRRRSPGMASTTRAARRPRGSTSPFSLPRAHARRPASCDWAVAAGFPGRIPDSRAGKVSLRQGRTGGRSTPIAPK
jgi:hypothetical protein